MDTYFYLMLNTNVFQKPQFINNFLLHVEDLGGHILTFSKCTAAQLLKSSSLGLVFKWRYSFLCYLKEREWQKSKTSQMSRHFDTPSPQLKDKPKKSIHKIMFKRHYTIHAPFCKQSKCLLQPPRLMFSGFRSFNLIKKNKRKEKNEK